MNSHARSEQNMERLHQKSFFKLPILIKKVVKLINFSFYNKFTNGSHNSSGASRRIKNRSRYTYYAEEYTTKENSWRRKKTLTMTFNKPKLIGAIVVVLNKWGKKPKNYIIIKKINQCRKFLW